MMSLGELQMRFPVFFVPKIHLMTSYRESFDNEKLIKMRFFTIEIHYISSQNDPNITHIAKLYGVSRNLI
jgi:hypothetical protein